MRWGAHSDGAQLVNGSLLRTALQTLEALAQRSDYRLRQLF
jgi:hypothetical protein